MNDNSEIAMAYLNYAHSYALSALALCEHPPEATHPESPVVFLYAHAIELYLKAYLLHAGMTLKELKSNFGHNHQKLAEEAQARGLTLTPQDLVIAQHLSETDFVMSARYIRIGHHHGIYNIDLHESCRRLQDAMTPAIYKAARIAMRPTLREGPNDRPW